MTQRLATLLVMTAAASLAGLSLLSRAPRAADGGSSALPRREDVTYRMPGVDPTAVHTLSFQVKLGGRPAFSAWYDSVTPAAWQGGPVYSGLTWFWRESGLPGDIQFVGYADASLDTVIYTTPILWLPLDPVTLGDWSTTSTNSMGAQYEFQFTYDGMDTLVVGTTAEPETLSCWRIVLEQTPLTLPVAAKNGISVDGTGIPWQGALEEVTTSDTLWYEAGALPRRRIAFRSLDPQRELLYLSHVTRDTPVEVRSGGIGALKARWKR
jgi:hypothetical protein